MDECAAHIVPKCTWILLLFNVKIIPPLNIFSLIVFSPDLSLRFCFDQHNLSSKLLV